MLVIITLMLSGPVIGAPYADLTFTVDGDSIEVSGKTSSNISTGRTSEYIDGNTFSFTTNQSFSDYIITVRLPDTADITEIETSGTQRISSDNGHLVLTSVGTNEPVRVIITYNEKEGTTAVGFKGALLVSAIILAGLATYFFVGQTNTYSVPEDINDRQERILRFVADNQPVTQQVISDELDLPKSSVSRNIASLTRQGYLDETNEGNAKQIRVP